MKLCVNCSAELPDSAVHCVYCGAKQPEVGGGPKRTMMGYPGMAEDVARRVKQAERADAYAATEALAADDLRRPPSGFEPRAVPPQPGYPPQPASQPGYPPQQAYPPQQGYPQQAYPPQQGYAQPGYPPPGYPPQPGYPQHGTPHPPDPSYPGHAAGPQRGHRQPPGYPPQTYPPPQHASYPGHAAPAPAYLASEAGYRASSPFEPWAESQKTLLLVFGVLLIAAFVAPWSVGETTSFSWTVLTAQLPFAVKMVPLFLAGTGLLAVVFGAAPLSTLVRSFAAAALGIGPVLFAVLTARPFVWQAALLSVGVVVLVAGLVVRSQYTAALTGRLLASAGAVMILALYFVPDHDTMPLMALLDLVADTPGKGKLLPIFGVSSGGLVLGLLPFVLTLAAFVVWIPAPSRAGAHVLAWAHIVLPLVLAVVALILGGDVLASLKGALAERLYLPLAAVAWLALAGYGIAGVTGKQLELS